MISSLSVIGLGKLGAPMAACFAASGFRVHAVDVDAKKVEAVKRGDAPVYEPQLQELLGKNEGRLKASSDIHAAVLGSDATFIVVATPSEADGSFSLRYALPSCESIGRALAEKNGFHLVVMTSTVMPGSTGGPLREALEKASGKVCGVDFGLCYSPEFIALGTVIRDFYNPDFLLIGESDAKSGDILADIYRRNCKNSPGYARMNWINAEITKLAVNTYITTKISYANMLARLCEKLPGADANVVTDALGLDTRIGSKYLKGAVSYGGPCFPRDNRALAALAANVGASSGLAEATDIFNRAQVKSLADLAKSHYSGTGAIGILGLTYKPDTDVVIESFGLLLAQALSDANVPVIVYDPSADAETALKNSSNVKVAKSAKECISQSSVVLLATPWREFRELPEDAWKGVSNASPLVLIDCWRALPQLEKSSAVHYIKLGFGVGAAPERARSVPAN
jgi:UDPglucose 6-dehydrogenase